MADEAATPTLGRDTLAEYGAELALACGSELETRLGKSVVLAFLDVAALPAAAVADGDEPVVDQLLRIEGDPPVYAHAVLTLASALALAAHARKLAGDAFEAALRGSFDNEARGALQDAMRSVADGVQKALGSRGLAALEVQDAREVPEPASDTSWLDAESFLRARFELTIDGGAGARLDLLFADLASEAEEAPTARCVCFVEAGEEARHALSELARPLGFRPLGLEPAELKAEPDERVLGAAALVIPFDLAGSAGLELVEALADDPRLAGVPIVVAAERPTRELVWAALRAGARSFVARPYDPAELRRRILAARGEPAEEQAGG